MDNESEMTLYKDLMNRRVPHILGIYFAAGWGILQFIDWSVNRYILSPYLVDFTLTTILSLIPSILILAYFHGAPGKDDWSKVEKIGIPVNILASIIILFMFFSAEDLGAATETVYTQDENGNKIERIIPKANFRKNLAIFHFKNNIENSELDWIGRGVTQGINSDICQDMFVNSHPGIFEKLYEKGFHDKNSIPLTIKREIAKEIHVEYFIGGEVSLDSDGQYVVVSALHRTRDGKVLAENTFKNKNIFSLIDDVSIQIKHDIGLPLAHIENSVDLPVTEITTESLKAFELWAKGLNSFYGKEFDKGVTLLENAISEDETFGMAYLMLQGLYVINNQGDKRLEIAKKAMEYIYKIPERFHYLVKIVFFESNGEMDKVKQALKMHLDLFPHDYDAREINARLYMADADFESVVNEYKVMLEIDPSRHELLPHIGRFYAGPIDDNKMALEYYERYLSLYPEDADIHYLIGEIHRDEEDFIKAKEYFDKVLVLEPKNIDAFISKLKIDFEGKEQIEKMYDAFIMCETAKDSVNLFQRIETELEKQGMISEMMENFEIYRKLYPSFATFFEYAFPQLMYPHHYVKINQTDKAFALIKEFEETYQMPFKLLIDMSYFEIYLALEDEKNSSVYFEKTIIGINAIGATGLLDALNHLEAKVYRLNGEYDRAIKTLIESKNADRDNHKIELAICYRLQEKHKDALKILNSMERRRALYELGILHQEMGDVDEALDYMNEFLDEFKYADPEWKKIIKAKEYIENWKNQS
ncbi:MAG: tetratricopeptide repeat protein [Candidatus Neomarinimicrobiota bacterium]|nr:tetratricopeptide repeat protein [Candidatus Neomarinimicrobiota bacterium]